MAAGWKTLPDVIFSEIMTLVGLESLGVLQKCRGVCKTWNVMICQMTRNEKKAIIREAKDLVAKIQAEEFHYHNPLLPEIWGDLGRLKLQLPEISTIAYLAHQTPLNISYGTWKLSSVVRLKLQNVDLTSVPAKHLASLASCVKFGLHITNVRTTTLVNILDNIKCKYLVIKKQSLGTEETQALVWAMESRVENVELCDGVSLDVTALTQYSGRGKCETVWWCNGETGDRYIGEVMSWGQWMNWSLNEIVRRQIQIDFIDASTEAGNCSSLMLCRSPRLTMTRREELPGLSTTTLRRRSMNTSSMMSGYFQNTPKATTNRSIHPDFSTTIYRSIHNFSNSDSDSDGASMGHPWYS